jgi:hypothetical protein
VNKLILILIGIICGIIILVTGMIFLINNFEENSITDKEIAIIGSSYVMTLNSTEIEKIINQFGSSHTVTNFWLASDLPSERILVIDDIPEYTDIVFYGLGYRVLKYTGPDKSYDCLNPPNNLEITCNERITYEYNSLKEIISILKNKDMKVVLFTTPHNRQYLEDINDKFEESFQKSLEKLSKDLEIDFIYLTKKFIDSDIYLEDGNHTDWYPKSKEYTHEIAKIISGYVNESNWFILNQITR